MDETETSAHSERCRCAGWQTPRRRLPPCSALPSCLPVSPRTLWDDFQEPGADCPQAQSKHGRFPQGVKISCRPGLSRCLSLSPCFPALCHLFLLLLPLLLLLLSPLSLLLPPAKFCLGPSVAHLCFSPASSSVCSLPFPAWPWAHAAPTHPSLLCASHFNSPSERIGWAQRVAGEPGQGLHPCGLAALEAGVPPAVATWQSHAAQHTVDVAGHRT